MIACDWPVTILFLSNISLQGCEECHLRKTKKSVKSLVVKLISSTRFLSQCQDDLNDFRDMSQEHNMSDSSVPFIQGVSKLLP